MPRELTKNDVFNMTYDKLRKESKKKRLSAAGKKSDLQFRLIEYLKAQEQEKQEAIHEEEEEEFHDAQEPMETDEPANRTFTIEEEPNEPVQQQLLHESTPTNAVSLILDEDTKRDMCSELGIDMHNFEVKSRPRTHRVSSRKSLRAADIEPSSGEEESSQPEEHTENRGVTPTRQRPVSRGVDRFALIHAKEAEKEETLGERRERMQKRHEDLTGNVPESIKRLATPKTAARREPLNRSATRSTTRSWQPQNPAQMTFKFGNNDVNAFSDVASARPDNGEGCSSSVVPKKTPGRARARVDVKQMTRIPVAARRGATTPKITPVTRPEESTFVDYMSTPKGVTPSRMPKRNGYTPHASKKVFVDTTGLTDREFNLASEEGLIPGKPATKTAVELRQLESKKRRDDIIALKRKMNIK